MFIRFITDENVGIFKAGKMALDDESTPRNVKEDIEQVFGWFEQNLKTPLIIREGGVNRKTQCWFKETAFAHIEAAKEVAKVLARVNVKVIMIKNPDPGTRLYEDEWQIVSVTL